MGGKNNLGKTKTKAKAGTRFNLGNGFLVLSILLGSILVGLSYYSSSTNGKNLLAQLPTSGDINVDEPSGNGEFPDSCLRSSECKYSYCDVNSGKCAECSNDSDCSFAGEECISGICTETAGNRLNQNCFSNDNCADPFICDIDSSKCVRLDGSDDSGSGGAKTNIGFNQSCNSGNGDKCETGLKCYDSKCVQCNVPSDCGRTSSGDQIACSGGICVGPNGLSSKQWCTKPSHCKSGKCTNNKCEPVSSTKDGGTKDGNTKDGSGNNGSNSGDKSSGEFDITQGVDLNIDQIIGGVVRLACNAQRIGALLGTIAIVYLGYLYLYGVYDPNALKDIKEKFKYVIIGLFVIFGVYIIIATVANAVGVQDFSFSFLTCN